MRVCEIFVGSGELSVQSMVLYIDLKHKSYESLSDICRLRRMICPVHGTLHRSETQSYESLSDICRLWRIICPVHGTLHRSETQKL